MDTYTPVRMIKGWRYKAWMPIFADDSLVLSIQMAPSNSGGYGETNHPSANHSSSNAHLNASAPVFQPGVMIPSHSGVSQKGGLIQTSIYPLFFFFCSSSSPWTAFVEYLVDNWRTNPTWHSTTIKSTISCCSFVFQLPDRTTSSVNRLVQSPVYFSFVRLTLAQSQ